MMLNRYINVFFIIWMTMPWLTAQEKQESEKSKFIQKLTVFSILSNDYSIQKFCTEKIAFLENLSDKTREEKKRLYNEIALGKREFTVRKYEEKYEKIKDVIWQVRPSESPEDFNQTQTICENRLATLRETVEQPDKWDEACYCGDPCDYLIRADTALFFAWCKKLTQQRKDELQRLQAYSDCQTWQQACANLKPDLDAIDVYMKKVAALTDEPSAMRWELIRVLQFLEEFEESMLALRLP